MGFLRGLGKFKFPIMLGIGFILAELVVTFAGCEVWLNINEELLCAGDRLEFRFRQRSDYWGSFERGVWYLDLVFLS